MTHEQDESDAQAEDARKKMKSRVMTEAGLKVSRQPPKNQRKNSKKATNAESVSESTALSTSSSMETGKNWNLNFFHTSLVVFGLPFDTRCILLR